jgi:hypothetical protein
MHWVFEDLKDLFMGEEDNNVNGCMIVMLSLLHGFMG